MKVSKEFRIGIFVVVILAVSFVLINYLRGKDIFNREMTVVSRFTDVQGLVPSAPVFVKGYKAGTVTDVGYDTESGDFEVKCSVLRQFRIPVDSKMTLYSVDIMGGKGIRIDLGVSGEYADDMYELEPRVEQDLISSLSSAAGPLFDKVTVSLDSLESAVSGINRIVTAISVEDVERMTSDLEATISNARAISAAVNGKSKELSGFISNLERVSGKLSLLVEKADTTVSNINGITSALDRSDVEGLIASLKSLSEKIQDPDGSIGRLLEGGEVYESVDSLLSEINLLVSKIAENPKKYLRISVF